MKIIFIYFVLSFNIITLSFSQEYNKCRIDIKYHFSEDNYNIDSSYFDLYIIIPKTNKSIDYRFNFSDIWEFDFIGSTSLSDELTLDEQINNYIKKGESKVIIEFSNGELELLSSYYLHATNLVPYYEIIHQDKESSNLEVKVFSALPNYAFMNDDTNKFKLYFILQKEEKCSYLPVVFESDWLEFDNFISK